MKNRIFIVAALLLSLILSAKSESFAGQASAQASILIIIPPREEERSVVEKGTKEEVSYETKVASTKDEQES